MLMVRLRRAGGCNKVAYRVVVSDSRSTPRAVAIEEIGFYDPSNKTSGFGVDKARLAHWTGVGATLSPTVARLVKKAG